MFGDQEGIYAKVKGTLKNYFFPRDKTAEYRKMALLCSLPKWEGFHVDEETQEMTATEAVVNLGDAVESLSYVWIEEAGHLYGKKPSHFDARMVSDFIH